MKRRLVTEKDGWLLERKSFDWQPSKKWGPQSYHHNELNNCTSKDWIICSFQGLPRGGGTTQEQWVLILNLCWQSRENRVEEKVGGAKKGLLHTWLFPIQIRGIPKIIWRGIKGEFLLSNVDIWTYNYVYFMATEKQQETQVTPCFQNECLSALDWWHYQSSLELPSSDTEWQVHQYSVEGVAELGCSLIEVQSTYFPLPVCLLGHHPIWNPCHSTKYWKHFTNFQLCIMLKIKWEHQGRGKNMGPETGMTNCVFKTLNPSWGCCSAFPAIDENKSTITYTLHIENLPKKMWDLRVDPDGVTYSWTRY